MTRRSLPEIDVRDAVIDDYADIMSVADTFFKYGGTDVEYYDRAIFGNTVMDFLSNDDTTHVSVATHDNKLVGYYGVHFGNMYSKRPMMYEAHFAVLPEYVRSYAGRMLTAAVIAKGNEREALCFYAGATSGIKQFDNSLINMYSKLGFVHSGAMMRLNYG